MKNHKLAYFLSGLCMLSVVLVVCMFSVRSVRKGGPIVTLAEQGELRNTIEIPLSEAADISVTYTSDNLKIYPIEGDTVIIKEYLSSRRENALASVDIGNGKATVTGGKRDVLTHFLWISINERIEIYLPKEGIQDLEIQTSSGNITTEEGFDLQAGTVSVNAKSGNIKWQETKAGQVDIEASSGNLRTDKITGDTVTLTARSGNISAGELSGKAEISAGSGNVTVTEFSGQGNVTAQSGNVKVQADTIIGDMSLEAGSGNVKLMIPAKLSFELEINTGSGNIHTDFDHAVSYNKDRNHATGVVGAAPVGKLSLKAGSGNVSLKTE
ncbi:MAG: DUF4097 family beta strand repeat protein [Lachnospiraceae bacterium]|nr:DUF4097 family beta strand repeat protein [Lachnospiraceae bacterium]